jgi:hypothetical protein
MACWWAAAAVKVSRTATSLAGLGTEQIGNGRKDFLARRVRLAWFEGTKERDFGKSSIVCVIRSAFGRGRSYCTVMSGWRSLRDTSSGGATCSVRVVCWDVAESRTLSSRRGQGVSATAAVSLVVFAQGEQAGCLDEANSGK